MLAALVLFLFNVIALLLAATDQGPGPRAPDGRRAGPVPVGEPSNSDREHIAKLHQEAAARRERELEAQAAAAEPAGEPPSEGQRRAVLANQQRSADVRGSAARALRRRPVPVGTVYDDERELVEDLHADARDARLYELRNRGIDDPSIEAETAGFPVELPHLPGSELYGVFECPTCGNQVERSFPGYVDWDLASRDLVCPHCGGIVKQGGAEATAAEAPAAEDAEPVGGEAVQTSAQPEQPRAQGALTDEERAELEQLRAERAQREAAATAPPEEAAADQDQPQEQQPPAG